MNDKALRGFAVMDPVKQRELARKGGRSVRPENRSFSKDRALAAASGREGGKNVAPEKRIFSVNPQYASATGRLGGLACQAKLRKLRNGG